MQRHKLNLTSNKKKRTPARSILEATYVLGLEIKHIVSNKNSKEPLPWDQVEHLMKILKTMTEVKDVVDKAQIEYDQVFESYNQMQHSDLLEEQKKLEQEQQDADEESDLQELKDQEED